MTFAPAPDAFPQIPWPDLCERGSFLLVDPTVPLSPPIRDASSGSPDRAPTGQVGQHSP